MPGMAPRGARGIFTKPRAPGAADEPRAREGVEQLGAVAPMVERDLAQLVGVERARQHRREGTVAAGHVDEVLVACRRRRKTAGGKRAGCEAERRAARRPAASAGGHGGKLGIAARTRGRRPRRRGPRREARRPRPRRRPAAAAGCAGARSGDGRAPRARRTARGRRRAPAAGVARAGWSPAAMRRDGGAVRRRSRTSWSARAQALDQALRGLAGRATPPRRRRACRAGADVAPGRRGRAPRPGAPPPARPAATRNFSSSMSSEAGVGDGALELRGQGFVHGVLLTTGRAALLRRSRCRSGRGSRARRATIREVLDIAIELEKRTMALYVGFVQAFPRPEEVRNFWFRMARHEAGHCGALALVEAIVESDPASAATARVWFDERTVARLRSLLTAYLREVRAGGVSARAGLRDGDRRRGLRARGRGRRHAERRAEPALAASAPSSF